MKPLSKRNFSGFNNDSFLSINEVHSTKRFMDLITLFLNYKMFFNLSVLKLLNVLLVELSLTFVFPLKFQSNGLVRLWHQHVFRKVS
jgi:hypothetical protein